MGSGVAGSEVAQWSFVVSCLEGSGDTGTRLEGLRVSGLGLKGWGITGLRQTGSEVAGSEFSPWMWGSPLCSAGGRSY